MKESVFGFQIFSSLLRKFFGILQLEKNISSRIPRFRMKLSEIWRSWAKLLQVPEEIRLRYPDIPWRGMSTLRNMLIHQYHRVDYERVWVVIEKDLPVLKREIEQVQTDAR